MNPIIRRELLEVLRTRRAVALQLCLALGCAFLVLVRWPTGEVADLSGARSMQVMRVFGYGLLAGILLLVPAFAGLAFSLYLANIEKNILGVWCIYCVISLGIISLLSVLDVGEVIAWRPQSQGPEVKP